MNFFEAEGAEVHVEQEGRNLHHAHENPEDFQVNESVGSSIDIRSLYDTPPIIEKEIKSKNRIVKEK